MKLRFVLDNTKNIEFHNSKVFESESDYFRAYLYLQSSIKESKDTTIILYSKPLMNWLVKAASKYRDVEVANEEITYKSLLEKKWNIFYDFEITDNEIKQDDLLSLPLEGSQSKSLSSFICQNFISRHLNSNKIIKASFGLLINDIFEYNSSKKDLPKISKKVYNLIISNLKNNDHSNSKLLEYIHADFDEFFENICLYKLIENYPQKFQQNCLSSQWLNFFRKASLNLDDLKVAHFINTSETFNNVLKGYLNIFFSSFKKENKILTESLLIEFLNSLSGFLIEEIEQFLILLKANPSLISQSIIIRAKAIFKPVIQNFRQRLDDLENFVMPKIPSDFDFAFDIPAALDWAVKEYLPYKFWLESTLKSDMQILKNGTDFAEYVFKNYQDFGYHYKNSIYRYIFNYKDIISKTQVPILLILDNFNYKFLDHLKSSFAQYRFDLSHSEPYISLLPTETSIAKSALISGKRLQENIIQSQYKDKLLSNWSKYFPNHKLTYLSKLGELIDYKPADKEFIVINYLQLDKELHESFEKTAVDHKKMVTFIISSITENISEFILRNHLERKSRVFFVADHGSSLIRSDISNSIDTSYFKNQNIDLSHRFGCVDDKKFNELRSNHNISDSVFFLNKELSGDNRNYIIARSYNRFKDINDNFYVHGGALPEEIIIPSGYFEFRSHSTSSLILRLLKTEYRLMSKDSIKLRLANPNNVDVDNIFIEVYSDQSLLCDFIVASLPQLSDIELENEIRLKSRNIVVFKFILNYEISGNSFREKVELPITIKTITKSSFDFDDL